MLSLILASLVAGLATTPYAAYHFHRLAPYGVLANLLAMPIVSAWVMPMGILGVVAIPFGFDAMFWRQMGYGIEWMDAVALLGREPAGRVRSRHRVRHRAAAARDRGAAADLSAQDAAALERRGVRRARDRRCGAHAGRRTFWLPPTGAPFAVRGADGRLAFHRNGGDTFAMHEWLAADADGRDVADPRLGEGIACDPSGCIGKLADGRLVSYALAPEALEEDCRRAAVVVATRDAPPDCAATVIGRSLWRERGALALRRDGSGFVIESARPANFDRPWAPRPLRTATLPSVPTTRELHPRLHVRRRATRRRGLRISRRTIDAGDQYRRNSPTSLP